MNKLNIHIDLYYITADSICRKNILRKYSSILLLIGFVFFVTPKSSFAQRDTTATSAQTVSIIEYLTPLEYAFMMHEETKFMLRLPVLGLGAEVEVLPYFTLMAEARFLMGINYNYYIYEFGSFNDNYSITGEARYYYGSRKKGINNMSGNYFGLGYNFQESAYVFGAPNLNQFYAKWGVQRRFLGAALIDFGINLGYERYKRFWDTSLIAERVFLQTVGTLGFGIVFKNEKKLDKDRLCPVLKCYDREIFLLKINTLNLVNAVYSISDELSAFRINPQIAVEQKLLNSPFSIAASLELLYGWRYRNGDKVRTNPFSEIYGRIQSRYYYNLKSRILKGKSGNGFSANYVSGGFYEGYNTGFNQPLAVSDYGITLTTGIQRTFSKHFYFDAELGGAYDLRNDEGLFLYGDVQVGIKF